MADIRPLRGIRFNPDVVRLGGVLAPPYDVISPAQQDALYGRDLRNVVRIDYGQVLDDDVAGQEDRYTRAAGHLEAWLRLAVLIRDQADSFYVGEQRFITPAGPEQVRRGIYARLCAAPWDDSELRPHERTMRGPKEDRLALMRATRMQTSAVFAVWRDAADLGSIMESVVERPAVAGGRTEGEMGSEKHLLWVVDDSATVAAIRAAMAGARLYVADGHHRYETAAAFAAERAAAGDGPEADSQFALLHLCDADDPAIVILPTHRLLRREAGAAYSLDDLWNRLADEWDLEPAADLGAAVAGAAALRQSRHAFAVRSHEGSAVLSRARRQSASPRGGLDVAVLEDEVLTPARAPASDGDNSLAYTRTVEEVDRAVASAAASLGFCLNAATTAEMIAVADAGEVMPQKSTYFYPKVPTGLVLSPV